MPVVIAPTRRDNPFARQPSSSLPQSSMTNVTPAATTGMTMESVARQSYHRHIGGGSSQPAPAPTTTATPSPAPATTPTTAPTPSWATKISSSLPEGFAGTTIASPTRQPAGAIKIVSDTTRFGRDLTATQSQGNVVLVTPEEAKQFEGQRVSVWEVTSTDPFSAVEEGAFASQTSIYPHIGGVQPIKSYELSQGNIAVSKKQFEAYRTTSSELNRVIAEDTSKLQAKYQEKVNQGYDYSLAQKEYEQEASKIAGVRTFLYNQRLSTQFEDISKQRDYYGSLAVSKLPYHEKVFGTLQEEGIALANLPIKIGESIPSIYATFGQQTFKSGEEMKILGGDYGFQYSSGSMLGKLQQTPYGVGGKIISYGTLIGVLGLGGKEYLKVARTEGLSTATAQAITYFSPFQSPSLYGGVFYPRGVRGQPLKYQEVQLFPDSTRFSGGYVRTPAFQAGSLGDIKAETLTLTQIPKSNLFIPRGTLIKYQPEALYYTSLRPTLSGMIPSYGMVDTSYLQIINIERGLIRSRQMYPTGTSVYSGTGVRSVLTSGFTPEYLGRYSLVSRPYSSSITQRFDVLGISKVLRMEEGLIKLGVSKGQVKFKTFNLEGGFPVGRPSIGRSIGQFKELGVIETETAWVRAGKTFDILTSGRRSMISRFGTLTIFQKEPPVKVFDFKEPSSRRFYTGMPEPQIKTMPSLSLSEPTGVSTALEPVFSTPSRTSAVSLSRISQVSQPGITGAILMSMRSPLMTSSIITPISRSAQVASPLLSSALIPLSATSTALTTSLITPMSPIVVTPPISPIQPIITPTITTPPINPFIMPPISFPFRFSFDDRLGSRRIGARKIRRYTPSFEAIVKGIKGKKPKGIARLSLGTRPITKGFKWFKQRRI